MSYTYELFSLIYLVCISSYLVYTGLGGPVLDQAQRMRLRLPEHVIL